MDVGQHLVHRLADDELDALNLLHAVHDRLAGDLAGENDAHSFLRQPAH